MERLTYKGCTFLAPAIASKDQLLKEIESHQKYYDRLSEYEDLGLTPAQLLEVDNQYTELAAEYGKVKKELEEYKQADDKLGVLSITEFADIVVAHMEMEGLGHAEKGYILTNEDAEKWEEYKRLEQGGQLLKLPCKVGDKVYYIKELCDLKGSKVVNDFTVYRIIVLYTGIFLVNEFGHQLNIGNFGRTVFLTREAAEAALKEMEEKENV